MSNSNSILIVEDEPDLRSVYALILKARGYDARTAVNGKAGLDALRQQSPRLVILDIFMPVMDGRDFLKNFDPELYPDVKILVCSNTSDDNLRDEMLGLGADQVVLKADMAPADLLRLVEPYFAGS